MNQTTNLSTANITGSPVTTMFGGLFALPALQGLLVGQVPHDTPGWVAFGTQLALGLLGIFAK